MAAIPGEDIYPSMPGNPFQFGDPGGGGGGGGGGFTGPMIPTFGQSGPGGQAMNFAGFGAPVPWSPMTRRLGTKSPFPQRRAGTFGAQQGLPPGLGPGNIMQWAQQQGQQQGPSGPFDPAHEQFGSVTDIINNLLSHGVRGDMPGYGGAFGLNPPAEIMGGIRSQAINDASAQERAARLGLQSRGDMDPSTYGFQALMSQLQGQKNVANTLGQADLGLRQQQLQNYWQMLLAQLGAHTGALNTEVGGRWAHANQPGWLGQTLGGLGGLAGGYLGRDRGVPSAPVTPERPGSYYPPYQ